MSQTARSHGILDPLDWWMKQHFDRNGVSAFLCIPSIATGDNAVLNRTADSDITGLVLSDRSNVQHKMSESFLRHFKILMKHMQQQDNVADNTLPSTIPDSPPLKIDVWQPSPNSFVSPSIEIRAKIVILNNENPLPENWWIRSKVCVAIQSVAIGSKSRFAGCLDMNNTGGTIGGLPYVHRFTRICNTHTHTHIYEITSHRYGTVKLLTWIEPSMSALSTTIVHVVPMPPPLPLPTGYYLDGMPSDIFHGVDHKDLTICILAYRARNALMEAMRSWYVSMLECFDLRAL